MSNLRVDNITDELGTGAPDFTNGLTSNGNLVVNSDGEVGIGTSSPAAQLHMSGTTAPTCEFTGSITSTFVAIGGGPILTVTAVSSGTIAVGDVIYGAGVSPITKIVEQLTGTTGSTGTYKVSVYQTVSSVTMYAASGSASKIRITETDTQVVAGQPLGTIEFFTSDSHNGVFVDNPPPSSGVAAYMAAISESTNVQASLVFGTRRSASASGDDANERLRIAASGQIGIGGANYGTSGQTIVSAGSGAAPAWGILPAAGGGTGVTTAPAEAARLLGYTSTATAAGTTTLTDTSSQYQLFTGSTTQTITLPVTSTLGEGWTFHIVNNSTGSLTVNSSGGNLVTTIISGVTAMVTCIGTTLTTAADWEPGFTDFQSLTGSGSVVLGTSPIITNAAISQSNAVRANGTLALAFASIPFLQVTPTATGTFTTTVPVVGTTCSLIVLTSGTTSYTMSFGTGFRSTGTLATGIVTARRFVFQFVSDGASLIESGRTQAQ